MNNSSALFRPGKIVFARSILVLSLLVSTTLTPAFAAQPTTQSAPKKEVAADSEPAGTPVSPAPEEAKKPIHNPAKETEGTIKPYVEEEDEEFVEDTPSNVSNDNFSKIEFFGLLEQSDGLGKQLYSFSRRSVITGLIKDMPPANWTVTRDLTNQVLLTAANPEMLQNDIPADYKSGNDLLTVRIEKLLQRGMNIPAYSLYTRMNVEPYNEKIAHQGIISMLLNVEKPLACVEMKTSFKQFEKENFWKEMDAYCVVSLSGETIGPKADIIKKSSEAIMRKMVEDKSFRMPYTPATFEKLSLFERGLLVGENRLDISGLTEESYKFVPPSHIQALLALPGIDYKTRILLTAQVLEKGVLTPSDLKNQYIKIGRKAEKEKKPLVGFEHIATIFWKRADTFEPEMRQASVAEVFEHAKTHGYPLLVPFLDEISKTSPGDSFTLPQIHDVVRAYLLADKLIPVQWLDIIKSAPVSGPNDEKLKEKLLVAAALMSADKDNNHDKLAEIYNLLSKPNNPGLANFKNIIENIDNRTGNYAKVRNVYEKDFDLEANKSYTMPPAALLDQLELSSKSHAMGETVLLCNLILQGIERNAIYAGVLADVARALSEVGLGKQSQRIVAEAVLGIEG